MLTRYHQFLRSAALFSLVATCFFLPFSTALLSLFSLLTLLFWIISGSFMAVPRLLRGNVMLLLVAALLALFIVGLLYTSAEMADALSCLKKYRELLFFPVVASLVWKNPQVKSRCENAFLLGCLVLMLVSYGMYFSLLPTHKYGYSLLFHITHNFFMSFFGFMAAHRAVEASRAAVRIMWIVLFLLCVFNMFYIATGRTGLLVFLVLMLLFLMQRLSFVKQLVGAAALALCLLLVYQTSETFHARSRVAIDEIQKYEYGASRTSLGMRFDWWINSVKLIAERPVFGHGTGAFESEHAALIKGTRMMKTDNPHNEFLLIGVQLGVVGGAIFVLILAAQLWCSFSLPPPDRYISHGVLVAMAVGCLANSFLFDTHQGHFWALLSSLYIPFFSRCGILPAGRGKQPVAGR